MKKISIPAMILISLVLFLGCQQKEGEIERFIEFPETMELKGHKLDAGFKHHGSIRIFDSLLVMGTRSPEANIHIYDAKAFEHIASAGRIGKGRTESLWVGYPSWDKNKRVVWCRNLHNNNTWKFEIDSILSHPDYEPTQFFQLPPKERFPNIRSLEPFKNGLYTQNSNKRECFLTVFNDEGKIVDSIPNKTDIYPDYDPIDLTGRIWYYHHINLQKKKIVFAYHHADIIVCTDFEGNVLFKRQGPDMIKEENPKHMSIKKEASMDYKETFLRIQSDQKYIYCLYNGRNGVSWGKNKDQFINPHPKNLFIYTWEGQPVMKLRLDHPTGSYALDKENDRIITLAKDIGKYVYYKIDFDELDTIN
jgi:hypothetical protein